MIEEKNIPTATEAVYNIYGGLLELDESDDPKEIMSEIKGYLQPLISKMDEQPAQPPYHIRFITPEQEKAEAALQPGQYTNTRILSGRIYKAICGYNTPRSQRRILSAGDEVVIIRTKRNGREAIVKMHNHPRQTSFTCPISILAPATKSEFGFGYHVEDLENAAILCVEQAVAKPFTYPESYCELFEAGARWMAIENDAVIASLQKEVERLKEEREKMLLDIARLNGSKLIVEP